MNCNEMKELLPFLNDGLLDEVTESDARAHVDQCEYCRHELEDYERTFHFLNDALSVKGRRSTEEFLGDVRSEISRRKRVRLFTYRLIPAAAVFFVALTISFYSLGVFRTLTPDSGFFAISPTGQEFSSYVAEYYLDVFEVCELADNYSSGEMYDTLDEVVESGYVDLDIPDIVDVIDEQTASQWLE